VKIEGTTFGSITVDWRTYEHDVLIRHSGDVMKRKKKLSLEKGCELLPLPPAAF
jgi:hypothetical protein